jgi:cell division transport system ATP-binding protein
MCRSAGIQYGLLSPASSLSYPLVSDKDDQGACLLKLKEVSKIFDDNLVVLDRISFQIGKGELVFLVGPNGAGKTTLLELIAGEKKPTEGVIQFDGFDSRKVKPKQIPSLRKKMGRIFQDFKLIKEMNVFDNVALSLRILGIKEKRIKNKVYQTLDQVGLLRMSRFHPDELSSGEKQKTAIARAMVKDPLLLLADEPTLNLDEDSTNEIMKLLKEVSLLGTAVLIATHSSRSFEGNVAKIIRIEEGKIVLA